MTRPQIVVLAVAGAVVAALWLAFLLVTSVFVDAARTPDPDPPGVDTLDRAAVERLARITLPADATGLHTRYAEGIDYSLGLCFTTTRQSLPGFLAASGLPEPAGAPPAGFEPAPGCPAPIAVRGSEQQQDGPVFRHVVVGEGPGGTVAVYVVAFTT